mmetsp:Transcript_24279/g.51609  ORF Transcript_24279/g.51609 Transcript_24279/m.51609 type:complete len:294 (+) Transcript_24279:558-1439(+)
MRIRKLNGNHFNAPAVVVVREQGQQAFQINVGVAPDKVETPGEIVFRNSFLGVIDNNGTNFESEVVVIIGALRSQVEQETSPGTTNVEEYRLGKVVKDVSGPVFGQSRRLLEFLGQRVDVLSRTKGLFARLCSLGKTGMIPRRIPVLGIVTLFLGRRRRLGLFSGGCFCRECSRCRFVSFADGVPVEAPGCFREGLYQKRKTPLRRRSRRYRDERQSSKHQCQQRTPRTRGLSHSNQFVQAILVCCGVLCCVVLCCAMLCCVVLSYPIRWYEKLSWVGVGVERWNTTKQKKNA